MKKTGLLLMLLFFTKNTFAQNYILPNEKVVFSFITKNCKKMVLAKDKNNNYLIYRFGSTQKIELEYPKDKNMLSWSKFRFSFYLRGGGVQNESFAGIDPLRLGANRLSGKRLNADRMTRFQWLRKPFDLGSSTG